MNIHKLEKLLNPRRIALIGVTINPNSVGGSHWVAALAAEIIAQSQRAFGRLAQGAVDRILIEGESGSMIVVPAGDQAALAVMVDAEIKLGLAMFQISRVAEQISDLLI